MSGLDYEEQISLWPELNEKVTINNVANFFKRTLPKMVRYSGRNITDLKSPTITDMPRGKTVGNVAETTIARRLYAESVVKQTIKALNSCDNISREIITRLYFTNEKVGDKKVWQTSGYQERRYYYYKNRAMLMFADSYLLDDLHVFEK